MPLYVLGELPEVKRAFVPRKLGGVKLGVPADFQGPAELRQGLLTVTEANETMPQHVSKPGGARK